jgi:hypothetical protein
MIEVVVAMLLLTIGLLAALQIVDAAARNAHRAEQGQVAVNVAERELEELRSLSYAELALTAQPGTSSDAKDPRQRVVGANYALNAGGTDQAELVVNGAGGIVGGVVEPGPTPFESGDVSGEIHRFVVWQDDPNISGTRDRKRVVVAARVNETGIAPDRGYFEVQSDSIDPSSGTNGTGAPPTESSETPVQSYWLSDTQDNPCGRTRQPITASHNLHTTTGACGAGSAYDNMYRNPPPRDPGYPTLHNYGLDVNPAPGTQGLPLLAQSGTCSSNPGSAQQIHTWRTPTLNLNVGGPLVDPDASLHLWTRLPLQSTAAELCIFVRQTGIGLVTPLTASLTGIANANCAPRPLLLATHFRCSAPAWPTDWTRVTIDMNHVAVGVVSRLEVSLAGHHTGVPGNQLQVAYDHPQYPSRLDLYPVL